MGEVDAKDLEAGYRQARTRLERLGQGHVLEAWDRLDPAGAAALLAEIRSVDWEELARLIDSHGRRVPQPQLPARIEPAPRWPRRPRDGAEAERYRQARARGEARLAEGAVAAFTVAGGQGSRLGWEGPKGTFPATPIRRAPLFQVFAEQLRAAERKWGRPVPWLVMTSPANDADTRAFFERHGYFGLDPEGVFLFPQAMMPAVDPGSGRVLMAGPGRIALSPNGHGGAFKALAESGALEAMAGRGVEVISYAQVDNPLVHMIDPLFIGLHDLEGAGMSSKALAKSGPHEKVGNFCLADGRVRVIEYSDMPPALAEARDASGALRFGAGSIAIHVLRRDFVEALTSGGRLELPFHRAEKKVPYWDPARDAVVAPEAPNAVKLEMFVFDALPLCERSVVLETDRVEEFAPIKNAEGEDSPATSRALQSERAARWLDARGVKVPRDAEGRLAATIEISPGVALAPEDLEAGRLPERIEPGAEVLLA